MFRRINVFISKTVNSLLSIRFFRILKDIQNYIFLIRTVRTLSKTKEWAKHRLRYGWFYQVGTIINMNKEDFGESEDIIMSRFMQRAQPVFNYFMTNNLGQILKPKVKRYEDHYAYNLVFWPSLSNLTIGYIITRTIYIYIMYNILLYLNEKYNYIYIISQYLKEIF